MMIHPSRYAHLPTKVEDYEFIISKIEDGMSVKQIDEVIAELKSKVSVKHHYRTNLKNLGLFKYDKENRPNKIILNSNVFLFKNNIISLKELLKIIVEDNKDLMYIKNLAQENNVKSFELQKMSEILYEEFENRKFDDIVRWIRPIIFLLNYIYSDKCQIVNLENTIDNLYNDILKSIQDEYFKIAMDYGDPVSIEEIESIIIKKYPQIDIMELWNKIYSDRELEYKLSFITFPSWALSHKPTIIDNNVFTHIRIKKNIYSG